MKLNIEILRWMDKKILKHAMSDDMKNLKSIEGLYFIWKKTNISLFLKCVLSTFK